MNKGVILLSYLAFFCALAHADDIANPAGDGSSVDIFQVANTISTGGTLDFSILATNQANVVLGNVIDNVVSISQQGSLGSATVLVNSQLPDDQNSGMGNRLSARVADISVATAGSVGSTYDATTTDGGSGNTVNLTQNAVGSVINAAIDGSANTVTITQNVDGAVINLPLHGTGLVCSVSQ